MSSIFNNGYRNLSILNISKEDEGIYSFNATNAAGSVSDKVQLMIRGK